MPSPEASNRPESDSAKIAKIIVSDTLKSQRGDEGMLTKTIEALNGERGDAITQAVMGEYLGEGEKGIFDTRVLQLRKHNVNAAELKGTVVHLLQTYSRLPEKERPAFLDGLTLQKEKRTPSA